jgi:hypothetical protein
MRKNIQPFAMKALMLVIILIGSQVLAETLPVGYQLQVNANSIKVYPKPDEAEIPLFEIPKGNLLDVIEKQGDWYRIKVSSINELGWVHSIPAEYGEMTVSLLPNRGPVGYALENIGNDQRVDGNQPSLSRPLSAPQKLVTLPPIDPTQIPPPEANLPRDFIPIEDRWRLMQALGFKFPWYDPYHQNELKGDLPVFPEWGEELFLSLGVISDTVLQAQRVPLPAASQTSSYANSNNTFGHNKLNVAVQNIILSADLSKGDTTFKPPEWELKFSPVINTNHVQAGEVGVLNVDPSKGTSRNDSFVGVQEMFADVHLRNVSERYDFDSVRVGIQPFTSDFRGFLYQDVPFGVRLFGNRDNNQYQYNLAWFKRIEKDTNSGLNDLAQGFRNDDIITANLYIQDSIVKGYTSQFSWTYNVNKETDQHYNSNGFLVRPLIVGDTRPHNYHVNYFGYAGEGHFDRWNVSTTSYLAYGYDSHNEISRKPATIFAGFHATEISRDFDWIRVRGNLALSSGSSDPYGGRETGFDAILENPNFAGSDTSYFIRQSIPLIGGGALALTGGNGLLPSLRSSKDEGQSNFINPGLFLLGVGADFDLTPELRAFGNISNLRFMDTTVLGYLLTEAPPDKALGVDVSLGFHWRPWLHQNVIFNGSVAALIPGTGLKQMYGSSQGTLYSIVFNAVLTF